MGDVRWLDEQEIRAWLKFRAVVELYPSILDSQLRRDAQLTHMEYQVLAMLSEAPGGSLRMSVLASRTNSSLTRMSHVVTRLSERGIVARQACDQDGRATNVVLTQAGRARLEEAAPGHVGQVRDSFVDALSPEQLDQLTDICDAILDRIDPTGAMSGR